MIPAILTMAGRVCPQRAHARAPDSAALSRHRRAEDRRALPPAVTEAL